MSAEPSGQSGLGGVDLMLTAKAATRSAAGSAWAPTTTDKHSPIAKCERVRQLLAQADLGICRQVAATADRPVCWLVPSIRAADAVRGGDTVSPALLYLYIFVAWLDHRRGGLDRERRAARRRRDATLSMVAGWFII